MINENIIYKHKSSEKIDINNIPDNIKNQIIEIVNVFYEWEYHSLICEYVKALDSYEFEITLDPYYVSGKEIHERTVDLRYSKLSSCIIENNAWSLVTELIKE